MMEVLILAVSVEAIVELLYGAEILETPRNVISKIEILGRLIACKYCMSVWVGLMVSVAYMFLWEFTVVKLFLYAICLHRMSNIFHFMVSFLQEKIFDSRINRKNS